MVDKNEQTHRGYKRSNDQVVAVHPSSTIRHISTKKKKITRKNGVTVLQIEWKENGFIERKFIFSDSDENVSCAPCILQNPHCSQAH